MLRRPYHYRHRSSQTQHVPTQDGFEAEAREVGEIYYDDRNSIT